MFGLANTLLMALVVRFLAGVFNGNIAVARAYIGDVSTPKQLATRMGLIGAAFGLGFTIGPFLGGELSAPAERWDVFTGTILETYPYLLPCLLASVLSIVSLLLAFRYLPESLAPESRSNRTTQTWSVTMKQQLPMYSECSVPKTSVHSCGLRSSTCLASRLCTPFSSSTRRWILRRGVSDSVRQIMDEFSL